MRVAFIVYGRVDQRSGGFLYDYYLISRLEEQGHTVEVISQAEGSIIGKILENVGDTVKRIRRIKADIIIADELNHPSLFASIRKIRRLKIPIVALVHHLKSDEKLKLIERRVSRFMEKRFLRDVDAFLFNSSQTASSVGTLLGTAPSRFRVVHPGAGNPLKNPRPRNDSMRILFVGNIIPRKGLDRLILALTKQKNENWELDVVGDGNTDPEYTRYCHDIARRTEIAQQIRFHGRIDEIGLEGLRESCEVLAVPSDYEGFGIVYLEAMRSGLIPIAAADGGAADLIRDGIDGYLVSADVPEELETALGRLIRHPDLRLEMATRARARAEDFPEWNTAMDKAVEFLEEVGVCP